MYMYSMCNNLHCINTEYLHLFGKIFTIKKFFKCTVNVHIHTYSCTCTNVATSL